MALSDCEKCWMTPCECGHEYKGRSEEYKRTLVKAVQGYSTENLLSWLRQQDNEVMNYPNSTIIEMFKKDKGID
jgi:hypothetical protein